MSSKPQPIKIVNIGEKRRYVSMDDNDSSYSECELRMTASTNGCTNAWARFLVVKGLDEEDDISKFNPFVISKWLQGVAPSGIKEDGVKKLRSGVILVEVLNERTSQQLLKLKNPMIQTIPVKISPHDTLNSSKGVIRCRHLQGMSDQDICQNLAGQGVKHVQRVKVTKDSKKVDTNTFFLTFVTPVPPKHIRVGYLQVSVDVFTPSPMRCFNCQEFGHSSKVCKKPAVCQNCGHAKHEGPCSETVQCTNCQGDHPPSSKQKCPRWIEENNIQKIKTEKKCSFSEAKKIVSQSGPSYVSVAAVRANSAKISSPDTRVFSGTSSASPLEERFMVLMENMDRRMQRLETVVEKMLKITGVKEFDSGGQVSATTKRDIGLQTNIDQQCEVFQFSRTVQDIKNVTGGSVKSAPSSSSEQSNIGLTDKKKMALSGGFVSTSDFSSLQLKENPNPHRNSPGAEVATPSGEGDVGVMDVIPPTPSSTKVKKKKKVQLPTNRERKSENIFSILSPSMDDDDDFSYSMEEDEEENNGWY